MTQHASQKVWILFWVAMVSCADEVTLSWEKVPGAEAYQLELEQENRRRAQNIKPGATEITLKLDSGCFQYRLRAKDPLGRWSRWSEQVPFCVPPKAPELLAPTADARAYGNLQGLEVLFRWAPSGKGASYQIEAFSQGRRVLSEKTDQPQFRHVFPKPGVYKWRVRAMLPDPPYSGVDKETRLGEFSAERTFTLEYPTLPSPRFTRLPTAQAPSLGWERVPSAEKYTLALHKVGEPKWEQVVETEKLTEDLSELAPGRYTGKLFATSSKQLRSPSSETTFEVAVPPPAARYARALQVEVQLGGTNQYYSVRSSLNSIAGSNQFFSPTGGVFVHYLFRPKFYGILDFAVQPLRLSSSASAFSEGTLGLGVHNEGHKSIWRLAANVGLKFREIPQLLAVPTNVPSLANPMDHLVYQIRNFSVLGPGIKLVLGVDFSQRLMVAFGLDGFVPMVSLGGDTLTSDYRTENWRLILEGKYRLSSKWTAGFGVVLRNTALSTVLSGASSGEFIRYQQLGGFSSLRMDLLP